MAGSFSLVLEPTIEVGWFTEHVRVFLKFIGGGLKTNNPFNPQNPINPKLFYGRKEILDRFKYNVRQGTVSNPINIALVGKWGIGKTSILQKLQSVTTDKDIIKVPITFSEVDADSFVETTKCILESIGKEVKRFKIPLKIEKIQLKFIELEKKKLNIKNLFLEEMTNLWKKIKTSKSLVILFIDDFYYIEKYFGDIRNCFQELHRRGCKYMLVITIIPEALKYMDVDEPVVRFFDMNNIDEFSKYDTTNMIRQICSKSGLKINISNEVLDNIYNKTRGHPYYITLFMHELIRHVTSENISTEHYSKTLPHIRKRVKTIFDNRFFSLTEREEEALSTIIKINKRKFSPKDIKPKILNIHSVIKGLEEKEVLEKVGYAQYQFRYPLLREYFCEKYDLNLNN